MLSDGREHGFRQIVTFEQVTEVEDRRLVGNCIATELEAAESAHGVDVVERFLRAGIGQVDGVDDAHFGVECRGMIVIRRIT